MRGSVELRSDRVPGASNQQALSLQGLFERERDPSSRQIFKQCRRVLLDVHQRSR